MISLQTQMPELTNASTSKCGLFLLLANNLIITGVSTAFLVILLFQGFSGIDNNLPLSVTTCNNIYLNQKYTPQKLLLMHKAIFISNLVSLTVSILLLFFTIRWICKRCSTPEDVSLSVKIPMLILSSVLIWSNVPPVSYFISWILDLPNCTATFNTTALIILLALSIAQFLFSILFWLQMLCKPLSFQKQQKYRQINTNQTQPNQKVQKINRNPERQDTHYMIREENATNSITENDFRNPARRNYVHDPTRVDKQSEKPHIYDSPSRRHLNIQDRRPVIVAQNKVTRNIHPSLRNIAQKSPQSNNFSTPVRQLTKDEDYLYRQQQKYYEGLQKNSIFNNKIYQEKQAQNTFSERRRPMQEIPRQNVYRDHYGVQDDRKNQQFWNKLKGQTKKYQQSKSRQGILANYLRSKYQ